MVDQDAAQATGRVVLTPSTRNDIPEVIPKVVSIRAGEGPADDMQEYGVRRVTTPAPTPVATDAVARQPQSTVPVLQQQQVYDKQSRDILTLLRRMFLRLSLGCNRRSGRQCLDLCRQYHAHR